MKPIVPRSAALASALVLLCACAVQPRPIQDADHVARAEVDRSRLRADQAPLTGRLALEDAISRALAYNLDARLTMMEQALQGAQLTAANFATLPRLAANAGYAARSNELAASAESVFTRRQTLEPSTSTDRQRGFADLTFAWNIIDVGLSYFQARQQADRALIAVERRRRVINNLVGAWWRNPLALSSTSPRGNRCWKPWTTASWKRNSPSPPLGRRGCGRARASRPPSTRPGAATRPR